MPKLIRLYIINVAIGFGIAAAFVAMLLYFNVANLWYLVTHSEIGWLAVLLLWLANGIVFAGVQFAIVIMKLKDSDNDEPRGGLSEKMPPARSEPALVSVASVKPNGVQNER